jgi:hypothetical protein
MMTMRIITTLVLSILSVTLMAQVPQGVGYQGVATDASGIELVNQAISIRASVLSGSAIGTVEWEETHATTTDTFGLFTLTIGQGTNTTNGVQASFADISWGTNTHFLKMEMDVTGGSSYSNMGTNQMMSVPYALYAESANINYDSIANYLSGDSTFITNVGGGMGGGGCDLKFPEGIDGESIELHFDPSAVYSYTVPAGKKLYLTNHVNLVGSSMSLFVNDFEIHNTPGNTLHTFLSPIVIDEGQVLSQWPPNMISNGTSLYGILVNSNNNIDAISSDQTYIVPSGKKLVVTNFRDYNGALVNNYSVANSWWNGITGDFHSQIVHPLILEQGDVLTLVQNSVQYSNSFNGYLVDEDYFADCGGGGSSEGGQGEGQNIGDMLYWGGDSWENLSIGSPGSTLQVGVDGSLTWNNYLAIGDDWAGGKIAYLFQPGDPGYIDGETHGFVVHPLHHSDFPQNQTPLGWGCDDIITGINNSTFGEGYNNTLLIASQCPTGNAGVFSNVITCAKFWSDLIYGGYDDWFMPNSSEALVLDSSVLPVDYFVLSEESTTNPLSQCITADFYIGGASLSWTGKSAGNLSIGIRQF